MRVFVHAQSEILRVSHDVVVSWDLFYRRHIWRAQLVQGSDSSLQLLQDDIRFTKASLVVQLSSARRSPKLVSPVCDLSLRIDALLLLNRVKENIAIAVRVNRVALWQSRTDFLIGRHGYLIQIAHDRIDKLYGVQCGEVNVIDASDILLSTICVDTAEECSVGISRASCV